MALQNAGVWGRVFLGLVCKNAAPDKLKLRFLKMRLKRENKGHVLYVGP